MLPPRRRESSVATDAEQDAERDAEVSREEHRALKWAALAAVVAVGWLVMPIGVGILLGMLLAFVMQPLYGKLKPSAGAAWSALLVVVGTTLTLASGLALLVWLFVTKGIQLTGELLALLGPGGMGARMFAWVGAATARFGMTPEALSTRTRALTEDAMAWMATAANTLLGTIATSALGAFFVMLTMHFMLRNWDAVALGAQETFPLRPDYTRALFVEFRRVGRTTLMGTVVTGLAQGVLATIGYLIAGVPEPLFFGAATAIASLVPAVGTMLVWLPVGIVVIALGRPVQGVFELLWGGLLVVAFSDYYVRPRLVRGERQMPSLVTFAALFGGVEVFGLKGLVVGPVVMSLAVAVLRLYATETRSRRHAPEPAPEPVSVAR